MYANLTKIFIFLFFVSATVLGCSDDELNTVPLGTSGALYVTNQDDLPISNKQFREQGIEVVRSIENYQQIDTLRVIYLHPKVIDQIPDTIFRELYGEGVLIVAFGTPASTLERIIKKSLSDDIPESVLTLNPDSTQVIFVQSTRRTNGIGHWGYYDLFPNDYLSRVFQIVETQLEQSEN